MGKLEKLHKFLTFWFSPWGAAKGVIWEELTYNQPFGGIAAHKIVDDIWLGVEKLDWTVLDE